eukprot:m.112845 g.112845  ORF g.112845 m.112845 type:complete len:685 (+) comp22849_c1_seq1:50-2104(+)
MPPRSKKPKMTEAIAKNEKCINTIRALAADTVRKANSGHPGAPMGCAPMAHLLWSEVMNYNPANPKWSNRDRFVLSNGHACALQYIMLHLTGYDSVSMDDLKAFRQLNSATPGHPENFHTAGIEVSTGPLGQGISNAVGLAIAETHLAAKFNKDGLDIVDHHTFVICGDGCLQEGVASESCSLAGHLQLGKLIVLYDDNDITIDGSTELSFSEDVGKRFQAYGWHVQSVDNGDSADLSKLQAAIAKAKTSSSPSLIKVKTRIGFGSQMEGTAKVHGSPLAPEDIVQLKQKFGMDPEKFFDVPEDVYAHFHERKDQGVLLEKEWNALFDKYKAAYPELASDFERLQKGELPAGWEDTLPKFTPESKGEGTRKYSGACLGPLVDKIPELLGGSADLTPSNNTRVKGNEINYSAADRGGRYVRYGVREHGMAAICNGLAAHGGIIPYCATFLVFTGYCLGSVRLSALSKLRVIYVMTHDSIGLGEDGPTHQPVETLATVRAIPNMNVIRPADGNETAGAYMSALPRQDGPTILAFSRQTCPNLPGTSAEKVLKGAYILSDEPSAKVILTGSGSEVALCVKAAEALKAAGIAARVVSFPSFNLFEDQDSAYRASVFPKGVPVLSVEASVAQGWHKYSHGQVCMKSYGKSGPGGEVFKHFGFNVDNVVEKAKKLIDFYPNGAPDLSAPF